MEEEDEQAGHLDTNEYPKVTKTSGKGKNRLRQRHKKGRLMEEMWRTKHTEEFYVDGHDAVGDHEQ